MDRRDFLNGGSFLGAALALPGRTRLYAAAAQTAGQARKRIVKVEFGKPIRLPGSHGDTWTTTWADDDELYTAADDTFGFNNSSDGNLAVHRLSGTPADLRGATVNAMAEFGKECEKKGDGAVWKASGFTCVDGVLYLSVSRHYANTGVGDKGGSPDHYWVQETWDASIVKSTDHGKTWSPTPKIGQAMFPGKLFSVPYFVQYGKDGRVEGEDVHASWEARDRFDYVYAVSNDGAWNDGNWMTMGRVSRGLIGRLDPEDWEFIHDWTDKREPIWGPRHDNAVYMFRSPGRTSMTGIHYLAPLGLYVLPQWYYDHAEDPMARKISRTIWEIYSAPAPWGPWTLFHRQVWDPEGFYNPCIPSKFISPDGRHFWIITAGDFSDQAPGGLYGLHMIPVTLELAL